MATEFDDSEHWGFFLTGQKLTSETGKYVRMSSLVLAALRAAGVFSTMEDGTVAPATDKLWLDKNTDPPTLKEWDATGASWVPMTYGRLFGRAAVGFLTVTGGTGNAVVISAPTGFQANRLYLITPTATNTGAATIQVTGVGTYNVKYGDGSDLEAGEFTTGRQTALFFDGAKFVVLLAVGASGVPDGSVTRVKLATAVTDELDAKANSSDVTTALAAVNTALAGKVAKAGDTMTGQLVLPASTTGLAGLRIPNGVAPTSPADGDVWRRDAGGGLFLRKGGATAVILDDLNRPKQSVAFICEQKAATSNGGTNVISAWTTRVLDTELEDPDGIVSISSNAFTCTVDCYVEWRSPFFRVGDYKTRLYNVTDAVVAAYGSPGNLYAGTAGDQGESFGFAKCIAGKAYRIEYYSQVVSSGDGLGRSGPSGAGGGEQYTFAKLTRVIP